MVQRFHLQIARFSWDRLGILVSSLCLLHCVALPVALSLVPFLGLRFAPNEGVHLALTYVAMPVAAAALLPGLKRHGQTWILLLGLTGCLLMMSGHVVPVTPSLEQLLTAAGGTILVCSHLLNLSRARPCAAGCSHA